ncbi:hypothetical protein GN330_22805 [Nitratireductor sp. CAU 1489]|uniref:Uncharacterized protein n=1 Tax=Nitratireductor arenosus TaxID=2682096 RepID=A0A844QR72_9HYPH|nr:hypothetical protein [Nitratireductor arenosus]MVB00080.1 hypothetical protein [Nitratireductor arenosus]
MAAKQTFWGFVWLGTSVIMYYVDGEVTILSAGTLVCAVVLFAASDVIKAIQDKDGQQ